MSMRTVMRLREYEDLMSDRRVRNETWEGIHLLSRCLSTYRINVFSLQSCRLIGCGARRSADIFVLCIVIARHEDIDLHQPSVSVQSTMYQDIFPIEA